MKRMLIDAAHAEETRVVILDGNKIDDFEVETLGKQQLKGNIYIGHVSRVEPSLQAAFITYGGNRNGFLAFGEVHPQFFAVSKSEKEQLLEEMAEQAARRRGADHDEDDHPHPHRPIRPTAATADDTPPSVVQAEAGAVEVDAITPSGNLTEDERLDAEAAAKAAAMAEASEKNAYADPDAAPRARRGRGGGRGPHRDRDGGKRTSGGAEGATRRRPKRMESRNGQPQRAEGRSEGGGRERNLPIHRRYRIQDVLKEGQKILVQVVKEERGSKGAALTTYFSLPGRYTVLMPNTPYAGGISRKITDAEERRQLRDAYAKLKVPDTMGLIIRTAGVGQESSHIKHDYENLTNLWQNITTQFEENDDIQCVHEDGSVIVRALRDMMSDDIEEIIISGARAYKMAKDFAKTITPEAVKLIKQHKDDTQLFNDFKVESKLNQLHHSRVTLPSGGYLVINPTEALVAVDINSGRATQERNIEETALKTNLEACEELGRQIRLRDLAGLIVVDFIDMEDHRNVRKVENAMRKVLRRDRARIQTGNISDFGLMEISRQRLRPSFSESYFVPCAHCLGTGLVHSSATSALMVLRRLEEDDIRGADRVIVTSSADLVLWILNHKRDLIRTLEERYKYQLQFREDPLLIAPDHRIEMLSVKADGSETSEVIEVTLREQPELPPEKRNYKEGRRRERDDAPREARPQREERPAREERADAQPPKAPGNSRRPQREERAERPAAEAKPAKKAQPKAEAAPAKPKPAPKPAVDEPLAVQKVAVENDDAPAVTAAPRRKFEIKKQADTDATDTPIAVEKVTAADKVEKSSAKGSKKAASTSGGIISRLIGR